MTDILKDFWAIIVAGVTAVMWLARLEARGISNASAIRRMQEQRKEDLDRQAREQENVAKLLQEIRTDIKSLMRGSRNVD